MSAHARGADAGAPHSCTARLQARARADGAAAALRKETQEALGLLLQRLGLGKELEVVMLLT